MTTIRLRYLLRPREVTDRTDLQVLSVYRDYGVIPKDSRSDNFNKIPEDITRYQEVRVGDFVVNKMKAWQGSVGISAHHGIVSPDYLVCSVNPSVDSRFMHHLLRSAPFAAEFGARSKGIRPAQWRIYWEDLAAIPVSLPALHEQRRVASFLDAEVARIDALLDARRSQLELFVQRRFTLTRSLLQNGVSGTSLQETHIGWLPRCPADWQLKKLRYVTQCLDGARIPLSAEERATRKGEFPYYGASAIVDYIDDYLFDEELVLLGEDGAQLANPRYEISSVVNGKIWVNNHAHVLRPRGISATLLAAILNVFDRELCMSGSTREKITQDAMNSLIIPVPSTAEQSIIERVLIERRAAQERVEQAIKKQIDLLAERRQALITAAVTGGITV